MTSPSRLAIHRADVRLRALPDWTREDAEYDSERCERREGE